MSQAVTDSPGKRGAGAGRDVPQTPGDDDEKLLSDVSTLISCTLAKRNVVEQYQQKKALKM